MLALNTWEITEDEEKARRRRAKTEIAKSQSPKRIFNSERDIDALAIDAPNPEEVGKEDVIEMYEKLWEASVSQLSISVSPTFRLEDFLYSLSLIQGIAVEFSKKLCADVAKDRTWSEIGVLTTNICVTDL